MKTIFIPIIKKNPEANDFTCCDGEIDMMGEFSDGVFHPIAENDSIGNHIHTSVYVPPLLELAPEDTYPTANIRIALQSGDAEKVRLMLNREVSRVDAASAERLMQAILEKSADALLNLTTDLRRQGLFILPFRVFTMTMTADGNLTYPSPQAVALPTDYPPHPEITASAITSDTLTLSLRFPVKPHRLKVSPGAGMPMSHSIRIFVSYPLYIPDPKEMKGSIGTVRCATGGNATGIRFNFLSTSALKASVAAPEKYYEMVGNPRTGYRISSKAASVPDYSVFVDYFGYVPVFPKESLLLAGQDVEPETDVLDWIADWTKNGEGYLPISLPYKYWQPTYGDDLISLEDGIAFPTGIDKEALLAYAYQLGMCSMLMTRPMALAPGSTTRRDSQPAAIWSMHVEGLPEAVCAVLLFGSHDCRRWHPLRIFNPHTTRVLCSPPRLWHRLILLGGGGAAELARKLALRVNVDYS